jgi:hypothetical protein
MLNAMAAEPKANWRERLRTLFSTTGPDGFSPDQWSVLRAGAGRFARDWAARAMLLGWRFDELFALHDPFANVSLQGAAWFIGNSTVTAVTANAITLRTESGSILHVYRKLGA